MRRLGLLEHWQCPTHWKLDHSGHYFAVATTPQAMRAPALPSGSDL